MARQTQKDTQFKPEGDKALSRKTIGVKVPAEIQDAISRLPAAERGNWLRKVITEAVQNELMSNQTESAA